MDPLGLLFALVILALVGALLWWALSLATPHLPQPVGVVLQVLFIVVLALMVLGLFTGHVSIPSIRLR